MPEVNGQVRVLAIDGGGIRGVIPAMLVAEIEQRTGRHATELFDVIAGTSTGGIIALGLNLPSPNGTPKYRAKDLLQFYSRDGARIFSRGELYAIESVAGFNGPKYPAESIGDWLREKFQDAELKDSLRDVVVTSYDIERRCVHLFRSWDAQSSAEMNFRMCDVARATSAAPTFFPPAYIESLAGPARLALVDGGVAANDPAVVGWMESRRRHHAEDVLVVSVGTGNAEIPIPYEQAKNWGAVHWACEILDLLGNAANEITDQLLRDRLPDRPDGPRYFRLQPRLGSVSSKMDDPSADHIQAMEALTAEFIRQNEASLELLCELLMRPRSRGESP